MGIFVWFCDGSYVILYTFPVMYCQWGFEPLPPAQAAHICIIGANQLLGGKCCFSKSGMDRSRCPVQVQGQAMGWSKKSTSAKLFLCSLGRCIVMKGWQERARGFERRGLGRRQKHLVLFRPPETNGYFPVRTGCLKTTSEAWEGTPLSLMNLSSTTGVHSEQACTHTCTHTLTAWDFTENLYFKSPDQELLHSDFFFKSISFCFQL